jgi:parvulin-like peptidyl-prolyl isomerase
MPRYPQHVIRRFFLFSLVLLALTGTACGRYLTTGVAVVNGVGISKGDLERQVAAVFKSPQFQGADPNDAEQRLDVERQVIVQLIQQELIKQEAVRLAVRVAESEVAERFGQVRAQFQTDDQFSQALSQNGLTVTTLRERIRDQLTVEKVQTRAIGDVTATEAEIRAAYGNGQRFEELHVRHILFTVNAPTEEAAKKKKAEDTLAQLRDGADFIALAKKVSEDTQTKPQGGDLGTVTRSTPLVQEFLTAAFALKKGQISGLVRTQFGFHIIKVEDRRTKTLDQARAELTQEINDSKRQDAFTGFMKKRVEAARIVVNPRYGDFNPETLSIDAHDFFVPPEPEPQTSQFPSR